MKNSGRGVSSGTTSIGDGIAGRGWMNAHYVVFFVSTFAVVAFLNILDLWTSVVALNQGLVEGNAVITKLAGAFGLQVVGGLLVMKVMAILGGLVAAMVGIKTKDRQVRKVAVGVMLFLALILVAVSVNNIYLINAN